MTKHIRLFLLAIFIMLLAAACTTQTPIPVFVTPTPVETTPAGTPAAAAPTTTVPESPAVTETPVPSDTTAPTAAATATETVPPSMTPTPAEGTFGPVIPPDYTVPPSNTPLPSVTPTPTISPTPLPGLNRELIGIQIHSFVTQEEWRQLLQRAESLNVGWVKVQFEWDTMEPDGPGTQSERWRQLELYMQDALRYGFRVMVSIAKAPDWARTTLGEHGPPSDPQYLANFIQHILDRYGLAIHAIEIWNEPNLLREWTGAPISGAEYMRLFVPSYNVIQAWSQANGHDIQVVTAGLAPTSTSGVSVDDRDFLRQMYQAGLANYPNVALGVHPYGWGNAPDTRCCDPVPDRGWDDDPHFFFLETIEAYRQIMVNYGHANAEMWVTEFGWATYDGFGVDPPQPFFNYVTENTQEAYTIQALDIIQNSGNYDYVGPMILWNLNFATITNAVAVGREEQAGYSLLRPDYSERPLYWALWHALNP